MQPKTIERSVCRVVQTIRVMDEQYCDPICVGYIEPFGRASGTPGCGIFRITLKTPFVDPDHPHYDDVLRCPKCLKAEVK